MAASTFCPDCGALNSSEENICFACGHSLAGAAAPSASAPGTLRLVRQRYRLIRQIGVGGFGAVYQAEDSELGNRLVAVKEMSARGLTPEEAREATEGFRQEALLLARLSHPNLPRIYAQFEEDGHWYLVMGFIEGETLEDYLARRGGSLPVKEALEIGLQLTRVLGYLHGRQPPIVFRDLKPSNVMRVPDGQVYLIDFGIARLFKPGQARDTIAFGSPGYAAPEQYGKAQTTPRSDVFSLGALLHHLLSGVDPSETPFRFKPLTMPRPAGLSTLVERMVDLDTARRPATMEVVQRELERMANDSAPWHTDEQALPGAYITPASGHVTGAYPRVAPATASWQSAPPAWQNPNIAPPAQGQPVLYPIPARKKRKKGWAGCAGVMLFVGFLVLLSNLGHSNYATSDTAPPNENGYVYTPVGTSTSGGAVIPVDTLAWSPDGAYIAGGGADGKFEVWTIGDDEELDGVNTNMAEVSALGWSPDSLSLALAGNGGQVEIVRPSGNDVNSYTIGSSNINAMAWSPNGQRLALAAADGTVYVVDALTGGNSATYRADSDLVVTVAWSPDGKEIASGGDDGTVQVWNSSTEKTMYVYHDNRGTLNALAWSPNGKRIASTDSAGLVQSWDALTGAHVFTYKKADGVDDTVAWSHDGRYLASGGTGKTVDVWAADSNRAVFTYSGHTDNVTAVVWSPNNQQIASASDDGTVQVWDALTGKNVATYQQI